MYFMYLYCVFMQAVTVAGSSDDDGTWVVSDSQLVYEESLDVDPSEAEVRLQERQAALLNRKHHLLSQVSYIYKKSTFLDN